MAAPAHPFVHIDAPTLHTLLPFQSLIPHLHSTLATLTPSISAPTRLVYPLPPQSSHLLLMPCWSAHPSLPYIGLKAVTSYPSISGTHAIFSLFNSLSGHPLASLDGTSLTNIRTASVSALAAKLLAGPTPSTLAVAGAGALAPYLVSAHLSAAPSISRVLLWNRTSVKAEALASRLREEHPAGITFEAVRSFDDAVAVADVVSCATTSSEAIVRGELLKPGAHLDLVGSFTPEMRECDDEALRRGRVFVDFDAAMQEAGELVGAFERGVLGKEDVVGTIAELAAGTVAGRRSGEEITLFKSVGTAVVDLLAAQLAYETYVKR